MTSYVDLEECRYFGPLAAPFLQAIGWLGDNQPYRRGSVPADQRDRLETLCQQQWSPMSLMGMHACELCPPTEQTMLTGELFVPDRETAFAAPLGIRHYVDAHEYAPPQEFLTALLDCPPIGSAQHLAAIRRVAPGLLPPPKPPCPMCGRKD